MNWTEEQITIVLYEYCRKPFGQFSGTKQFVKDLAELLGRTPGAIVRKVGNLASLDPLMEARNVGGLSHRSKLDDIVWNKYYGKWDQLTYDAEILLANLREKELEESASIDLTNIPEGKDRLQIIKRRINQNFFRDAVLSSYQNICCISGLNNSTLLEACHIVDWSINESQRTNPENGLCMNPLFHKAYDELLLGITPDYVIKISDEFLGRNKAETDRKFVEFIKKLNNRKIILPKRFLPNKDLLAQHYEKYSNI